ncbi:Ran-binding-domain-containing protein [Annulohypoxylon maeteangense]|uniref:Ran-binding-domain-containing protein n=1 Tax=Annulohypoxylon maeteangense TaxID=1927788 RepID=UPI00200884E4|nr:Ran-binding-domain-containing protein [Annulohypoxylon maeteangense]KAI0888161.1 Ran-binding-domain-containing protein [Annulohypoxylon maeteangense]
MDAFLAKLSYHATNYAIRSCLALTSTYVIQQGSRLLKTVDDDPLRTELSHLQRRLARKIELVSPILESIEFRYTRGNSALEAVVRTAQELRTDVDSLGKRLENAALADESRQNGAAKNSTAAALRRIEIQSIITDIKQLIVDIDDSIPLINLWVSAIGGIQTQPSAFSPSRLLQASMLVNVGDTQYILNSGTPMQIGPDFVLSIYMLFRAHTSREDPREPYGLEDDQRKPLWQEVIHKARVRLRRVPFEDEFGDMNGLGNNASYASYAYQLQIVEDLDDGRVHTVEDGDDQPSSYDGVRTAGIREFVPVHQISKMFYADVGRILNINNDDGASSNPVLLLKRDTKALHVNKEIPTITHQMAQTGLIQDVDESATSNGTLEAGSHDDANDQLQLQLQLESENTRPTKSPSPLKFPQDLDPEWLALEVFDINDDGTEDTEDEDEPTPEEENQDTPSKNEATQDSPRPRRIKHDSRHSADSNLVSQLSRMSLASSRPSSRNSGALVPDSGTLDEDLLERSPFGAIQTSLSLLEMLLRLTSLQEFEQTTHLAIPDHVLRFYLDESTSRADADAPVHRGVGGGRS